MREQIPVAPVSARTSGFAADPRPLASVVTERSWEPLASTSQLPIAETLFLAGLPLNPPSSPMANRASYPYRRIVHGGDKAQGSVPTRKLSVGGGLFPTRLGRRGAVEHRRGAFPARLGREDAVAGLLWVGRVSAYREDAGAPPIASPRPG
jgi:hypothetical protein